MKDFLLSVILPRKMVRHRKMSFFLSLLIFFGCMIVSIFSSNLMMKKYVSKDFYGIDYSTLITQAMTEVPTISIDDLGQLSVEKVFDQEIYTSLLPYGEKKLELEIVFDTSLDASYEKYSSLNYFNLDAYYRETTYTNKEYALFIFSKDRIFYVPNKAKEMTSEENYQHDKDGKLLYYLPKDESELHIDENYVYDISYWTKEVSSDDVIDFTYDSTKFPLVISPSNKLSKNVNKSLLVNGELCSVTYRELIDNNFDFDSITKSLKTFIKEINSFDIIKNKFNIELLSDNKIENITSFTINKDTAQMRTSHQDEKEFTFNRVLKTIDSERLLDFTLVIDDNLSFANEETAKFKYFDLEGYYKQKRKENTTYVLMVYSRYQCFYLFDLGQVYKDGKYLDYNYTSSNSIFELNSERGIKYYLPKDPSELRYNKYGDLDTTIWTREVSKDDVIDFKEQDVTDYFNGSLSFDLDIKPANRHNQYVHRSIFSNLQTGYSFVDLKGYETNFSLYETSIKSYLVGITNSMKATLVENNKMYSGIIAFGLNILFPLLIVAIVTIASKRFFLKKFSEYYAICSITYVSFAVLALILGFIIPFEDFALYLAIAQVWYYIYVTFRINSDKNNIDDNMPDVVLAETKRPKNIEYQSIKQFNKDDDNYTKIG